MILEPSDVSRGLHIKTEIEEMIDKHGYYILLLRPIKQLKCMCWNSMTKEGNPACNSCMGTGNVIRYERHKVRSDGVTYDTLARAINHTATGPEIRPMQFMYMKTQASPESGMLILEVDWKGLRPLRRGLQVYEVNITNIMRGENGEPSYIFVGLNSRPALVSRFNNVAIEDIKVVDR